MASRYAPSRRATNASSNSPSVSPEQGGARKTRRRWWNGPLIWLQFPSRTGVGRPPVTIQWSVTPRGADIFPFDREESDCGGRGRIELRGSLGYWPEAT